MRSSVIVSLLALTACDIDISAGEVQRCALGAHSRTLEQSEAQVGRPFALDRRFHVWDEPLIGDAERTSAAAGHTLVISFRTRLSTNEIIPWAQIADGSDPRVAPQLTALAESARDFGEPILLIFHDEANDDAATYGSPADFVASWKRVVGAFRDAGASNVQWVWSLTSRAFPEQANEYYPGDDWVDWIGVTGYNWYTGDPISVWRSFASIFASFIEWGRGHDKPLMIVSTACGENPRVSADDPRSKSAWIRQAITSVSETPEIQGVIWLDNGDPTDPYRNWQVDSSPQSLDAFRELAADPHFDISARTTP